MPQLRRPELQRQLSRGDGITSVFSWPQSHTSPSCAAPSSGSSGSSGGISSFVLSLSSSRPVNITSCAPTLGAWGACLRKLSPHAAAISDFSVGSLAKFTRSIFHSPWRFPCRRGTRVIISTPFIPVHVTFAHRVTTCTGSTDKERRLSRSTRNP